MKKYLLVQPDFPIPTKSKKHKNFLPSSLLKLAAMLELKGNRVKIVMNDKNNRYVTLDHFFQNNETPKEFIPNEVWITSLFTYWISYVKECVSVHRNKYPHSKIVVGGIAASLFGKEKTKKLTGCDSVFKTIMKEAEEIPRYKLKQMYNKYVPEVDYQIIHSQRGCFRKCEFCGVWIIEPVESYEKSIKKKIFKKKLVFYDNNFLQNPHIHDILDELIQLKEDKTIKWCESQSGFDGRLLRKDPELATKIKTAGFRQVRIAWDWGYKQAEQIKKQLDILEEAGYNSKNLEVFMLYNYDIPFNEMEKKRAKCFEWKVQIADCRYRPLDQEYDQYNPRKLGQTKEDYYIHEPIWSDILIKQFRKNVRRHNICVRMDLEFHIKTFEQQKKEYKIKEKYFDVDKKMEKEDFLNKHEISFWDPSRNYKEIDCKDHLIHNSILY